MAEIDTDSSDEETWKRLREGVFKEQEFHEAELTWRVSPDHREASALDSVDNSVYIDNDPTEKLSKCEDDFNWLTVDPGFLYSAGHQMFSDDPEQEFQEAWKMSAPPFEAYTYGAVELANEDFATGYIKDTTKKLLLCTRLCKFYKQGNCSRGRTCTYAHGAEYLQRPPLWQKTRLCPSFAKTGFCSAGDLCTHAHGKQERVRRRTKKSMPEQELSASRLHLKGLVRKTQTCRYFSAGLCTMGDACDYAHGLEELQARPNLERSQLCYFIQNQGFCPVRDCKYAHTADEMQQQK